MDEFSGLKLLQLRRSRKITRGQLAKELGGSSTLISNWEMEKSRPREQNVLKMAQYFGVEIAELFKPIPEKVTVYVPVQQIRNYEPPKQPEPVFVELSDADMIDKVVQSEWRLFKKLINDYTSGRTPLSLGLMQSVNELRSFLWTHVKQEEDKRKLAEMDISQRLPWIDEDGSTLELA